MHNSCEACGARLDAGAVVCGLCGTPVAEAAGIRAGDHDPYAVKDSSGDDARTDGPQAVQESEPAQESAIEGDSNDAVSTADDASLDCDVCGQQNPAGARFCNRCGARLVPSGQGESNAAPAVPAAPKKAAADEVAAQTEVERTGITALDEGDRAVGKQVIIVVSAALLLVVVLYFVTTMSGGSQGDFSLAQPPEGQQIVEPLATQWQDREGEIMADIEAASGEARIEARRRLIDLYFAADRLDFAAEQTILIAEATGAEEEWILAGNLYFDWMQRAPDAQKTPWSQKAVAAYQEALTLNPENLDVRTDMAIAYMYDPQNSMMAIQETNRVLASDSMHVQANFNRGIMLSQINRMDMAIQQFEKVKQIIGDPEDPIYQRAENAILRLSGSDS